MSALSTHEFSEMFTRQYQKCLLIDVQSPLSMLKITGAIQRSHLSHYATHSHDINDLLSAISDCRTNSVDYFIFYDENGQSNGNAAQLAMLVDHYTDKQGCFIVNGIDDILLNYQHLIDMPNVPVPQITELRELQKNLIQSVWYPLKAQYKDFPRQILDNIYLSGKEGATPEHMKQYKIDVVIRIGFFLEQHDTVCHSYKLEDVSHENIESIFDETSYILKQCQINNKNALVHCHAGVSRSSTIILYYMMKYLSYSLKDAFEHTFKKRPIIRPNEGFAQTLIKKEMELFNKNTLDVCWMSYDYNIYREYLEFQMRAHLQDEAVDIKMD
eukprot:NODE_427_length_7663_cov_0.258461.p3 type:complete len:328 gc:universal NODE_427_length_7663_cov_0.258461:3463-2480(-)